MEDLTKLIGKTLKREDVILKVRSVSVGESGTVYIHPGDHVSGSFGWTYRNPDGNLVGKWEVVADTCKHGRGMTDYCEPCDRVHGRE